MDICPECLFIAAGQKESRCLKSGSHLSLKLLVNIFTSSVLIGFVIGISAWKMPWGIHGPLMGLIVGVPAALGAMMGSSPQFGKYEMFIWTIVMGMIYWVDTLSGTLSGTLSWRIFPAFPPCIKALITL